MKVYNSLPKMHKFRKYNTRALPIIHGWLKTMDNLEEGQWLLCRAWPIEKRQNPYSYKTRYRKDHPEYTWECRQISETEVGLFGQRNQIVKKQGVLARISREQFEEYRAVQRENKYNMFDSKAREMTTLSKKEWIDIMENIFELRREYESKESRQ